MKLETLPIGPYEENIYILHEDSHVLIIDPGRFPAELMKHISPQETVDGIVLTHGHSDHTGAVDDLAEALHCPVFMHHGDLTLTDPSYRLAAGAPVYTELKDLPEGELQVGTFALRIYHTPGHSAGSILVRYRNHLFTGDTLFAGSIGRTDLFGGDEEEMLASLQFIRTLPHDLAVYPGHGPASTIARELKLNPYLQF
ncbi:MAG: MBL fold metallo-hydrolase [Solobacterium sp.]|nr:MBL fold metallo-hydrolase [Solobacterium sp.]